MKDSIVLKSILIIAGLLGIAVGAAILFTPVFMFAANGIELSRDTSLLSEIRAPGGALLAAGILVVMGAFIRRLTFTAVLLTTLLYLSYGVSRLIAMAMDGLPASGLVAVTALEIGMGLVGAFALMKYREDHGRVPAH